MLLLLALIGAIPAEPGQTDPYVKRLLMDRARCLLKELNAFDPRIQRTDWERLGGRVTKVTEDTITIRQESGLRYTFEVAPALASKQIPLPRAPITGHRLNQVRVGDIVHCCMVPTPRGHVILALGIIRRPGGKIPVAEDAHRPESMRLHIMCGKDQAREEACQKVARMLARFHH